MFSLLNYLGSFCTTKQENTAEIDPKEEERTAKEFEKILKGENENNNDENNDNDSSKNETPTKRKNDEIINDGKDLDDLLLSPNTREFLENDFSILEDDGEKNNEIVAENENLNDDEFLGELGDDLEGFIDDIMLQEDDKEFERIENTIATDENIGILDDDFNMEELLSEIEEEGEEKVEYNEENIDELTQSILDEGDTEILKHWKRYVFDRGSLEKLYEFCCKSDYAKVLKKVLRRGISKIRPTVANGGFITVAKENNKESLKVLLEFSDDKKVENALNPAYAQNEALHTASELGHDKVMKKLMKHPKVSPTSKDFLHCCANGKIKLLNLLIEKYGMRMEDNTPLVYAIRYGKMEVFNLLINSKECRPEFLKNLPLKYAIIQDDFEIVKMILSVEGIKLKITEYAIAAPNRMKELVDLGLFEPNSEESEKLFLYACRRGDVEKVKYVSRNHLIPLNFNEFVGMKISSKHGNLPLLKFFVEEKNFDCSIENQVLLEIALVNCKPSIVQYLASKKEINPQRILWRVCGKESDENNEIIENLLKNERVDPNFRTVQTSINNRCFKNLNMLLEDDRVRVRMEDVMSMGVSKQLSSLKIVILKQKINVKELPNYVVRFGNLGIVDALELLYTSYLERTKNNTYLLRKFLESAIDNSLVELSKNALSLLTTSEMDRNFLKRLDQQCIIACKNDSMKDVVEMLIKKADFLGENSDCSSPKAWQESACQNNCVEILTFLLNTGKVRPSKSLFSECVEYKELKIVEVYLQHSDLRISKRKIRKILKGGNIKLVRLFLKYQKKGIPPVKLIKECLLGEWNNNLENASALILRRRNRDFVIDFEDEREIKYQTVEKNVLDYVKCMMKIERKKKEEMYNGEIDREERFQFILNNKKFSDCEITLRFPNSANDTTITSHAKFLPSVKTTILSFPKYFVDVDVSISSELFNRIICGFDGMAIKFGSIALSAINNSEKSSTVLENFKDGIGGYLKKYENLVDFYVLCEVLELKEYQVQVLRILDDMNERKEISKKIMKEFDIVDQKLDCKMLFSMLLRYIKVTNLNLEHRKKTNSVFVEKIIILIEKMGNLSDELNEYETENEVDKNVRNYFHGRKSNMMNGISYAKSFGKEISNFSSFRECFWKLSSTKSPLEKESSLFEVVLEDNHRESVSKPLVLLESNFFHSHFKFTERLQNDEDEDEDSRIKFDLKIEEEEEISIGMFMVYLEFIHGNRNRVKSLPFKDLIGLTRFSEKHFEKELEMELREIVICRLVPSFEKIKYSDETDVNGVDNINSFYTLPESAQNAIIKEISILFQIPQKKVQEFLLELTSVMKTIYVGKRARVMSSSVINSNWLDVQPGDVVKVKKVIGTRFIVGEKNGEYGLIPFNNIELLEEEEEDGENEDEESENDENLSSPGFLEESANEENLQVLNRRETIENLYRTKSALNELRGDKKSEKSEAVVIFDHEAKNKDELDVKIGDLLKILERSIWRDRTEYHLCINKNSLTGLVPSFSIEVIEDEYE